MNARELESVVPLVKVALLDDEPPTLELGHDDSPVLEPLVADLLIAYAFDEPDRFTLVNNRRAAALGKTTRELRDLAIRNLVARLPPVELHGDAPAFMVTCGGNFEASLLLLDDFWSQMQEHVPGRIVAAVPARDLLFVSGEDWPRAREFLNAAVSKNLERGDLDHPLSAQLLVREEGIWRGWDVH